MNLILSSKLKAVSVAISLILSNEMLPHVSWAQSAPSNPAEILTDLPLYYALGGSTAASPPASLFSRLDLFGADTKISGSLCGQFDPAADVANILSSSLDQTMAALNIFPQSIVGALPGYILCRAQPGMCQLLQHYVVRAENSWESAIRSCEADTGNVMRNGAPFRDWTEVAKVQEWQRQVDLGSSASKAKKSVDSSDGCVTWVGGTTAGCLSHEPIWLTQDTARAGWCLIQNQNGNCTGTVSIDEATENATLHQTWPNADKAIDWVVGVVGDHRIHVGSSPAAIAGTGLLPRVEDETAHLRTHLHAAVYSAESASKQQLDQLSAPQVRVTEKVINALKDLPDRDYLISRLANEIALLRVVNKAFLGRRLLLSGMMEPNIQATGVATEPLLQTVSLLETEIERAVYEMQLSRRLISETAHHILSAHQLLMAPKPPSRQQYDKFLP